MKYAFILLISFGLATLTMLAPMKSGVAQENYSPKSLIKIVKNPVFDLPIDCTIGENCWVMNYVDIGPDDGKKTDPACLNRTYDGHKGTDFAIRDELTMKNGVNILAAMDGTIKKVRNGETDRWPTAEDLAQTKEERKECGNAILIDHGNGLQSIYCHLQQNSISVKPNQKIKSGDVIGKVGLSGYTQFPHLHFGIIWEGTIIDPFTGQNNTGKCRVRKRKFWNKNLDLEYQQLTIQNSGFLNVAPNLKKLEKNATPIQKLPINSEILSFWVTLLGARTNDHIIIEIRDPNGKIFARREIIQPKTRARQFYYTGRKLNGTTLKEGAYTGLITVSRKDINDKDQSWSQTQAILITP